ncbi:hypothetical protein NQZ68_007112 [Dissostichus eleginoides]|nr:hypothetical protein NQZ68_007112 [Dissostichus eleginoides]
MAACWHKSLGERARKKKHTFVKDWMFAHVLYSLQAAVTHIRRFIAPLDYGKRGNIPLVLEANHAVCSYLIFVGRPAALLEGQAGSRERVEVWLEGTEQKRGGEVEVERLELKHKFVWGEGEQPDQ